MIPKNVRFVVSTAGGRSLRELERRKWAMLRVEPLSPSERTELIRAYLRHYGKELRTADERRISESDQAANPLHLRVLLDELRVVGEHDRLDECIMHYLQAQTTAALYDRVLERYERDYGHGTALVSNALCLLWASRGGLTEAELLQLLGSKGRPLPSALWSPLALAADSSLMYRGGMLGLFHEHVRTAIAERYDLARDHGRSWHLRLADYFDAVGGVEEGATRWRARLKDKSPREVQEMRILTRELAESLVSMRRVTELPWQLARAREWPRLHALLEDPDFLGAAWKANPSAVLRFWAELESTAGYNVAAAYDFVVDSPGSCSWWGLRAVLRLLEVRQSAQSRMLRVLCIELIATSWNETFAEALKADAELAAWVFDLWSSEIVARLETSNVDRSFTQLKELAQMSSALGLRATLVEQFIRLGQIRAAMNQREGAATWFERARQTATEADDDRLLEAVLSARSEILAIDGDIDTALALMDERQRICRRLGQWPRLADALNSEAAIRLGRGELEKAMRLLREAEAISREHGLAVELAHALANQAIAFKQRALFAKARERLAEAEAIFRRELARQPFDKDHAHALDDIRKLIAMEGGSS